MGVPTATVIHLNEEPAYLKIETGVLFPRNSGGGFSCRKRVRWQHELATEHHDPVNLLRAPAHSKKAVKKKGDRISCSLLLENRDCGLPGRIGRPKKLAFLQERDDWLSAASGK